MQSVQSSVPWPRRALILWLPIAALLVLAACTDEGTPTPGTITPVPGATITPVPGGTITPVPNGTVTPVPGGTITPSPDGTLTPTPGVTGTPPPATPTPGTPTVTPTPPPDVEPPDPTDVGIAAIAADLTAALNQHLLLITSAMNAAADGNDDELSAATQALDAQTMRVQTMLAAYQGEAAASMFGDAWSDGNQALIDLVQATDGQAQQEARDRVMQAFSDIADALAAGGTTPPDISPTPTPSLGTPTPPLGTPTPTPPFTTLTPTPSPGTPTPTPPFTTLTPTPPGTPTPPTAGTPTPTPDAEVIAALIEMVIMPYAQGLIELADAVRASDYSAYYALLQDSTTTVTGIALLLTGLIAEAAPDAVAVRGSIQTAVDAWNMGDVEMLLFFFTDQGFQQEFDSTKADGRELLADTIGTIPIVIYEIREISIDGNEAVVDMTFAIGSGLERSRDTLVFEDGVWKFDSTERLDVDLPAGLTVIDVDLNEFAFVYDPTAITDSRIAFQTDNVGQQPHELALLWLADDAPPIEQLVLTAGEEGPPPEVAEFLAAVSPVEPGEQANLVLSRPLDAGRYALVCFLPDTEDPQNTPHALKGMVSEFTIE